MHSSKPEDPGRDALQRIADVWQVDDDRVIWTEELGGIWPGTVVQFDWWPGQFRVRVRAVPAPDNYEEEPGPAWRLTVETSFLKGVRVVESTIRTKIADLASLSPTHAFVYRPPELLEHIQVPEDLKGELWLQSTAYLRPDMAGWLPEFFARMAILQPIFAEKYAEHIATWLDGTPNTSAPNMGDAVDHHDDILTVGDSIFAPKGKEPNGWIGSSEFEEFMKWCNDRDQLYCNADPRGLTLEAPFGSDSSLIRVMTREAHPYFGTGLTASLVLPFSRSIEELETKCAEFSFMEATTWTGFPQFASWTPKRHEGNEGKWYPGLSFMVPNALYDTKFVQNVAVWQLGRARWIKKTFWPNMKDLDMAEILRERGRLFE